MNRFEALDIDDFEDEGDAPDQSERDAALQEDLKKARAAGLGPELDDLEKLRALQRRGGSEFAKKIYDYDRNPKVKKEIDALFAESQFWLATKKKNQKPDYVWRTRDGRLYQLQDMEPVHLLNTARYLTKLGPCQINGLPSASWLKIFEKEANRRGRLL